MFKKLSLGILCFIGACVMARAGGVDPDQLAKPKLEHLPPPPPAVAVTAPTIQGSWEIGIDVLYQRMSNNELQYGTLVNNSGGSNVSNKGLVNDPKYHWQFSADVLYNIPGEGRFVRFAYTRNHSDDSDGTVLPAGSGTGGSDFISMNGLAQGVNLNQWDTGFGKQDIDYHAYDLVTGQRINVGSRVQLIPFAGVRYTDIQQDDQMQFTRIDDGSSANSRTKIDIKAAGPRFGMGANVYVAHDISVTGRIAGSLLFSDSDRKDIIVAINDDLVPATTVVTQTDDSDKHQLIPEVDARLGVNYTHGFLNDTVFMVEAGYEMTHYFDVLSQSSQALEDTVNLNGDYALHGPYFRVQLDFA